MVVMFMEIRYLKSKLKVPQDGSVKVSLLLMLSLRYLFDGFVLLVPRLFFFLFFSRLTQFCVVVC